MPWSSASSPSIHHLSSEESAVLAWMLEVTACRCRLLGDSDAATSLEGGAASLRLASFHPDEFDLVMTEVTIDDLTTIALDLLDQFGEEAQQLTELAEDEWSRIGSDLLIADPTGQTLAEFTTRCPRPENLASYASRLVSQLRTAAHIEIAVS